ncbi:YfhO family protein [Candidatus Enterococcus clewellii]|uniref:ABC transporter permease n=1 Tax=Candidatus Enterococcus clewellii TaxID=1834193 RepID=A0A242K934_9ENTE|nr:YfhO family protein [Enterococcus sp. 9E7_DIV0242]OTP17673.1 hypothetical protein A5888_001811 [Enterococcus sp. 9E7_DIV0242]
MTHLQRKKIIRNCGWPILLSFSLPVLIMVAVYYSKGIYPGSELSLLASDAFSQYANFHASFNNVLQGKQSIFYTWSGSLGLNYWSLMGYYLNGLFTPLVGLADNLHMTDTLYYLTLLKFGASGIAFWVFSHNTYRINRWMSVGLSVAYALMAYTVGYSEVIMWLDTFVYLPLIILGIHRLMDQKKPVVLFISYLLMFLSNFYMAFMVGVFSALYFLARTCTDWPKYKKSIGSYLVTAFLAGGASMVTILPTVMDLRANGESITGISRLLTKDVGPWDLIAKNLTGVYDTSKFGSMPFIYIGLLPLVFCVFYFVSRKIPLKNKLLYAGILLFLVASVYLEPLNLFWHGLHAPNMFLFRFSFLISFMVILLAGYGLEAFNINESNRFVNSVLGVGGVFLLFLFLSNKKRYGVITTESLLFTIGLLIAYLVIMLGWLYKEKWRRSLVILLLTVMAGEAAFNAQALISGIKQEWSYPSSELYTANHSDIQSLVDAAEGKNETFFRMENMDPTSLNESFRFGYHGVTMFSSIRNRHSSQYVNALGYRSLGTNLQVHYENNTLLGDSLMGIKYNLGKESPLKFGYEKVAESGKYWLYENKYALPLGILTDEGIYEEEAVRNQTEFFNYLSQEEEEVFFFRDAAIIGSENALITEQEETVEIGEEQPNQPTKVTWMVTVPAKTQGYLSLTPTDFASVSGMHVTAEVDGISRTTPFENAGQYFNLGYYEETTSVEVTAEFLKGSMERPNFEIYKPDAVFLDTEKFATMVEAIQKKGVDFKEEGRKATASVSLEKEQVVLTTIPYDKGWSVLIDGKQAEITSFKDAFLSVKVPKGTHDIEFIFLPQGFKIGAGLFVSCILLFIGYIWRLNMKQREGIEREGERNI